MLTKKALFLIIFFNFSVNIQGNLLDLTWSFNRKTIYWKKDVIFNITKQHIVDKKIYRYAVNEFCAAEHGGTHFDAPYHFYENGLKVNEIGVERLFAKGALINLTAEAELLGRDIRLNVKHLEEWQQKNGEFQSGSVLLVCFGKSKFWPNRTEYMDIENDTLNFPGISIEATDWIVNSKKIYGVGVDTPSIDPGNTTDYYVHTVFAKNGLYNLENVKLLEQLPDKGFEIIVAPMKIEDGTGAPVRIFAKII